MKKKFSRKRESEPVDVDITSLLDILTILLVFLLMNYSASDLKLDITPGLELAESESKIITKFAPVVQLNKEHKVFLNNKEVGRLPASGEMKALTEKLKEEKAKTVKYNEVNRHKQNAELVNLVFDKDTDYQLVQRVMHDSALAGYSQFKFIVKANY